jgi:hypothetical protein
MSLSESPGSWTLRAETFVTGRRLSNATRGAMYSGCGKKIMTKYFCMGTKAGTRAFYRRWRGKWREIGHDCNRHAALVSEKGGEIRGGVGDVREGSVRGPECLVH